MIDLSKLTPLAKWKWLTGSWGNGGVYPYLGVVHETDEDAKADIEFVTIARKAFAGDTEALAWWENNRVRTFAERELNGE